MKRFFLFTLVATMFTACVTDETQDVAVELAPDTLTVSFEGDDSRIQLQNGKTVWTQGDLVSVFYRSNANQKWQYQGSTGERTGNLKRINAGNATETTSKVVVVYPYNERYYINPETCDVEAFLPAQQTFLKDSYGLDGNIMISSGYYNQFSLKNVCGWLKVQLTGNGDKVKSIKLKGNNGEQVAGQIYINSATAEATLASEMGGADDTENGAGGNLVFDDTILTEVTLDCGEGVELGAEPTAFYIALPPQTFAQGLTIEITACDDAIMTKSTSNSIIIERNAIQPMAAFEAIFPEPKPANNEIWYTSTDGTIIEPNDVSGFDVNVVSNTYENGKGVIKFDGDVTSIGGRAFYDCTSLTSVTIPDSVTEIGEAAFARCSSLTSVIIPNSVTNIGNSAFSYCDELTSVTIENGVTSIGLSAFYCCKSLTSITIPDSVTSIGDLAFSGCSNLTVFYGKYASSDNRCLIVDGVLKAFAIGCGLTEYTIPNSVTKIGYAAFYRCNSLTSVTIPDSVTEIGEAAFKTCSCLTAFNGKFTSADNRCLIVDGVLKSFAPAGLTEYIIPNMVTSIGNSTFEYCKILTSITIPDSVTSIGNSAFFLCYSLKNIYCKPTTPPIGDSLMLSSDVSGRKIYVPIESVEAYKTAEYWSKYASDITGYDFEENEAMKTQPNNEIWYTATEKVTPNKTDIFGATIISNEWDSTTGKGIITFDNDITLIGGGAFSGCSSLTSITIGNSVTLIGTYAFSGCSSLTSITIPNSVTEIGEYAFYDCTGELIINSRTLVETNYNYDNYPSKYGWLKKAKFTKLTIGSNIERIGVEAFGGCSSITSITIGDGVISIGDSAFSGCSSLTSVIIGSGVTSIGKQAFYTCHSLTAFYGKFATTDNRCLVVNGELNSFASAGLTEYIIPDSITSIGDWAFAACINLTSFTIPDSVNSIGERAFSFCNKISSLTIPDSVTEIGEYAFFDCYGLRGITIGNSVTSIRLGVFNRCDNLTSVTIPDSVTEIEDYAFNGCSGIRSITIGNSVTSIGSCAFYGCSNITSITIPKSVTSIGSYAFESCTSLKEVYCKPTTPPAGSSDMFYNNASGRKIYVPTASVEAYKAATHWSNYDIVGYDF